MTVGAAMGGSGDRAVSLVEDALRAALLVPGGAIAPSTEAQIQSALHMMRSSPCDAGLRNQVEQISTTLALMLQAKRSGRPNLYESKMLRLKRLAAAGLQSH